MKTSTLFLTAAIPWLFSACQDREAEGDMAFAKETFESMARGDSDAVDRIDWETFSALGIPVGQQYLAFETEEEKQNYTTGFVTQFSTNFRESGGSVDDFTNWRVTSHDGIHTKVTADSDNGSLKLTVSERDGKERLTSFDIEE